MRVRLESTRRRTLKKIFKAKVGKVRRRKKEKKDATLYMSGGGFDSLIGKKQTNKDCLGFFLSKLSIFFLYTSPFLLLFKASFIRSSLSFSNSSKPFSLSLFQSHLIIIIRDPSNFEDPMNRSLP
jgi:hypothetical protein